MREISTELESFLKKMGTKKIKGVVFDMDGLIFDSERVVQRSWNYAGKHLGFGEEFGNHIYNTIGFNAMRRKLYFEQNVDPAFPMEEFQSATRAYFHQVKDTEGVPLKLGAKELMTYAKNKGYKVAVATSSSRKYAVDMLTQAGIYDLLDACVCGDMVEHGKPHPEIYLRACEAIGLYPIECIALEDSPAGIQSAHKAGLKTIMIPDLVEPTEETKNIVDFIYENLLQVIDII